jgi:hypothetical protein
LRRAQLLDLQLGMEQKHQRFPGLKLNAADRKKLDDIKRLGALRERDWRRVRILELLDAG